MGNILLGYRINKNLPDIFWGDDVEIKKGLFLRYQRNVFHTRNVFALDVGASFGYWKSRKMGYGFFTFSAFPVFRFTALHTNLLTFIYFILLPAQPIFQKLLLTS